MTPELLLVLSVAIKGLERRLRVVEDKAYFASQSMLQLSKANDPNRLAHARARHESARKKQARLEKALAYARELAEGGGILKELAAERAKVEKLREELAVAQAEAARSWDAFWAALTALECVCPTRGDRPTCRAIDRMRKALVETEGSDA